MQAQPWDLAAEKYAEGDVIHGKVVRIVPFGAFVEVIDAKILKLDCAEKKMTLSIKALEPKPENLERKPRAAKAEEEEGKEKAPRKPRAPKPVEEVTEWNEGGMGGISIADLLNKTS